MNAIPTNPSDSCKRRNPHLYGGKVGKLEASKPKPTAVPALVSRKPKQQGCSRRLELVVTMCVHRRRIIDDDNNIGSLKPLRDAIAKSCGLDDGDRRIKFNCTQVSTQGRIGVQVTIERL